MGYSPWGCKESDTTNTCPLGLWLPCWTVCNYHPPTSSWFPFLKMNWLTPCPEPFLATVGHRTDGKSFSLLGI